MKKDEVIEKYGEKAWETQLAQTRAWLESHPGVVRETSNQLNRKGGQYYDKKLKYNRTGLPGDRKRLRSIHGNRWRKYKRFVAPGSQLHHCWMCGTAKYRGLALVEANAHMHGFIDVIEVLEGQITLFTEEEIRNRVI